MALDLLVRHAIHRQQRILEDMHLEAAGRVVLHRLVVVPVALTASLGGSGCTMARKNKNQNQPKHPDEPFMFDMFDCF